MKQRTITKAELLAAINEPQGERDMAAILDELPFIYSQQFRYAEPRKFRADFAVWRADCLPDFVKLCLIEVVGGIYNKRAHGSITGILADIDRLNEATVAGWKMLRFTPDQIKDGRARELLERLL